MRACVVDLDLPSLTTAKLAVIEMRLNEGKKPFSYD